MREEIQSLRHKVFLDLDYLKRCCSLPLPWIQPFNNVINIPAGRTRCFSSSTFSAYDAPLSGPPFFLKGLHDWSDVCLINPSGDYLVIQNKKGVIGKSGN